MSTKNPLTRAGIEPATFRFVAQHLNDCAAAVPTQTEELETNGRIVKWDVRKKWGLEIKKYKRINNKNKRLNLCAHKFPKNVKF